MPLLYLGYMLVLSWAFFDGLEKWWGAGAFVSVIAFGLCAAVIPGGGLFIAGVAFYGAYEVWRWEWWQAGLFAFPGVALTAAAMIFGGALSLLKTLFGRSE